MSVYVDALRTYPRTVRWPYGQACHLFSDDPEELHRFADRIGLQRRWFQQHARLPHYDLTRGMRWKALQAGAIACDDEFVARFMERRAPQPGGKP
jgi:hypothetical protein